MVNIFGAGSNQIVIYCDAINDFTYGFFPITITNIFSRETKTFKPDVITKNTRFIKLCFNLVSSQAQEDLSNGKIYIKAQGTFEFQVGNSGTFNTNVSLMNPYRIVEVIEAQVALREQEVQYTSFISENEDLTAYVFLDDDPCPDGNCPPTDCYIPSVGERYGGGVVYKVDTNQRIFYVAALDDLDGRYDWGDFGKQIVGVNELSGKIDTQLNQQQVGKKGQAADIIKDKLINGYNDWYIPSYQEWQDALSAVGTQSLVPDDRLYWTSTQGSTLNQPITNDILYSNLFPNDNVFWSDVDRDRTLIPNILSFTGDFDTTNTTNDYPTEIEKISGIESVECYYQQIGERLLQEVSASVLEARTYYTYRVYLKPFQGEATGSIFFNTTHTGNSAISSIQISLVLMV